MQMGFMASPVGVQRTGLWSVEYAPCFEQSITDAQVIFPDIREKLKKFIDYKLANPVINTYGKHDKLMVPKTPLAGFCGCHLRDDAVLIYRLKNRVIFLIKIVSHAEIEGKRLRLLAQQLAPYR